MLSVLLSRSDINRIPMSLKLTKCEVSPVGEHWWSKETSDNKITYLCRHCGLSALPVPVDLPLVKHEPPKAPVTGIKRMLREWEKFRG